jgi:hypothetical protein
VGRQLSTLKCESNHGGRHSFENLCAAKGHGRIKHKKKGPFRGAANLGGTRICPFVAYIREKRR